MGHRVSTTVALYVIDLLTPSLSCLLRDTCLGPCMIAEMELELVTQLVACCQPITWRSCDPYCRTTCLERKAVIFPHSTSSISVFMQTPELPKFITNGRAEAAHYETPSLRGAYFAPRIQREEELFGMSRVDQMSARLQQFGRFLFRKKVCHQYDPQM